MRVLIIDTFYEPYLANLYKKEELLSQPWIKQHEAHFAGGFGTTNTYSHEMKLLGVDGIEIVANSKYLQRKWAEENQPGLLGIKGWEHQILQILDAQISWWKPDVVYVQDINWVPAKFLKHIRQRVDLIVGQNACPLLPGLDLRPYDLVLTSLPHYIGLFKKNGVDAQYFPIGFDDRLLGKHDTNGERIHELTFVGGLGGYHNKGTQILEEIAKGLPLRAWGYGGDKLPEESNLFNAWNGEAWGDEMYELLAKSKITINRHIDIAENYANNMRLYEATGMGVFEQTQK